MWRWIDEEQCLELLDSPPVVASDAPHAPPGGAQPARAVATTSTPSYRRPTLPEAAHEPPDVVFHVGGCAFALHLAVLQLRCPWLYSQLQTMHDAPSSQRVAARSSGSGTAKPFALRVLDLDTAGRDRVDSSHLEVDEPLCPLRTVAMRKPMAYVHCIADAHRRFHADNSEQSSGEAAARTLEGDDAIAQRRKRTRPAQGSSVAAVGKENQRRYQLASGQKKRARRLFETEMTYEREEKLREVLHVELLGADALTVVPVIEYIYTFKVRLLHDSSAWKTAQLAQWIGMGDRLRYSCLSVSVRYVTTETWMEMLMAASRLDKEPMRRVLCSQLMGFMRELLPAQYHRVMTDVSTGWLGVLEHHDMLVRVVAGLISNVRLLEFWRKLLDGLGRWLARRFGSLQPPSLRAMHQYFTRDWEPYVELPRIECYTNTSRSNIVPLQVTLLEFGEFVLQACINVAAHTPILWRVIRRTSPKFMSEEPEVLSSSAELADDPEFWIRGHLTIKYQPSNRNGAVVTEETNIEYQHCRRQYCKWRALVTPSQSTSAPALTPQEEGWVNYENPESNYYRRTVATVTGKLFLWGDPVCSLYHFLLQMTLFYSAPSNAAPEVAEIVTVHEMQRMPVETLALVLCSDRLRVPDGERTLLRCLNQLAFGLDVYCSEAAARTPRPFKGRAQDVTTLYRCVRWCFVPIADIIATLRWSPRELRFYELIIEALNDPYRCCKRRRPWGWRKYRDAYRTNETNLIEFEIEAGEKHLSPAYFPE
ncbi:hypothetical protein BBJ28_00016437 [Nothophytophthora sp. Chile5]|nr:hypothetical protein BBJ28_00016437 [Nothophytophthora sp. Chile5]